MEVGHEKWRRTRWKDWTPATPKLTDSSAEQYLTEDGAIFLTKRSLILYASHLSHISHWGIKRGLLPFPLSIKPPCPEDEFFKVRDVASIMSHKGKLRTWGRLWKINLLYIEERGEYQIWSVMNTKADIPHLVMSPWVLFSGWHPVWDVCTAGNHNQTTCCRNNGGSFPYVRWRIGGLLAFLPATSDTNPPNLTQHPS